MQVLSLILLPWEACIIITCVGSNRDCYVYNIHNLCNVGVVGNLSINKPALKEYHLKSSQQ